MTIQEYFGDWSNIVDLKEADRIIRSLSKHKSTVCPDIKNVFKAFNLCSFHDLRVLIIGQDPYCQKDVATGIAFANSPDTPEDSYSPSLEVLKNSVIDFTVPHRTINFDPSLEKWEAQGVLLLNAALSCELRRPGSHYLMWRPFMKSFLTKLSNCSAGIVYILMGTAALSLEPYINIRSNHVIRCRHPSYYARNKASMPSDIWEQVNNILICQNGYGIKWYEEA